MLSTWLKNDYKNMGVAIAFIHPNSAEVRLHGFAKVGEEVNNNTLFEIGSITKPLVAFLFVESILQNKLALDAPLSSYPIFDSYSLHDINLLELITHQSGLPRMPSNFDYSNQSQPYLHYTKQNLKDDLSQITLNKKYFQYSNYAYGLLGNLASSLYQQDLATLLSEQVFTSFNMHSAQLQLADNHIDNLAYGHNIMNEVVPNWRFGAMAGAGAVVASIDDMVNLTQAILSRFEQDAKIKLWFESPDPNSQIMALGWMKNDGLVYWHSGMTAGFASFVAIDLEKKCAIVILSNVAKDNTQLGWKLFQQFTESNL